MPFVLKNVPFIKKMKILPKICYSIITARETKIKSLKKHITEVIFMAQIKVSPKALEQDATTLATMNADLKKEVQALTQMENSLSQMWEGPARDEFHNFFQKDNQQMIAFCDLIDQYVRTLADIAQSYDNAENQCKTIVQ